MRAVRRHNDPRIEKYEPLIRSRARKFHRGWVAAVRTVEDLQGIAREAVWQATLTWRHDGGASFGTYVAHCVFNALNNERKHLSKAKRAAPVVSLTRGQGDEASEDIVLVFQGPAPDARHVGLERRRVVREAVDALPDRLKEIVERRFWRDETLETIAKRFQLSRERIRQLESRALDELRPKLVDLWEGSAAT